MKIYRKIIIKSYSSSFLLLRRIISKFKFSEKIGLEQLAAEFLQNNLTYTASGQNFYMVGNESIRFLLYKVIPIAAYRDGKQIHLNAANISFTGGTRVVSELGKLAHQAGIPIRTTSTIPLLGSLIRLAKQDNITYGKFLEKVNDEKSQYEFTALINEIQKE